MAQSDFGTGKTLAVLAIVLGCFAILWPKIFYPMWQAAFALSSSKIDADGRYKETERPPHLHPGSVNPRMRAGMTPENVHEKFMMREGRPFPNPQARQPAKSQPKSGGAMSIIMPIYTVGIIVFFIYTVLKLVFKKNPEEQKKPLIKDFHMDPDYRKFVCQQTNETPKPSKPNKRSNKKKTNLCNTTIPENENEFQAEELDVKDYEIFKLKKKLEETEQAMERIIEHMGAVNATLNKRALIDVLSSKSDTSVRNRRRGGTKKKSDVNGSSKKWRTAEEGEDTTTYQSNDKELEKDLAELFTMCTETGASIKSFDTTSDLPSDPIEEDGSEDAEGESMEEESEEEEDEKDSLLEDMIKSESRKKMPCK